MDINRMKLDIKMVQKRVQRLNKENLRPDALMTLQNNLNLFYSVSGRKQPTNSTGISMKGLNQQDIKTLHRIVMSFARNPLSTRKGIREEYEKTLKKTGKLSPNIPKQIVKKVGKNIRKQLDIIHNYDDYVTGVIAQNMVWSEQLRQIWYDGYHEGKISENQAKELEKLIIKKTLKGDYDKRSPDKIRQLTLEMINRRYRQNKVDGYVDIL